MTKAPDALQVKDAQRKQAKRATFEALKSKKRAEREFTVVLNEGEDPVSLLFRAIGAQEYDKLLTRYPPTKEQQAEGASFNQDKFAPALLSRVCVEPVMDEDEWTEIWNSPDWNRGEIGAMFWAAVELCNKGMELGPTVAG